VAGIRFTYGYNGNATNNTGRYAGIKAEQAIEEAWWVSAATYFLSLFLL
jgi:hypothetical protein